MVAGTFRSTITLYFFDRVMRRLPRGSAQRQFASQLALEHFAVGVPRQALSHHDAAKTLLPPDLAIGPLQHIFDEWVFAEPRYDHSDGSFTPTLTGYADHGDFGNRRVSAHDVLKIYGIDVLAA